MKDTISTQEALKQVIDLTRVINTWDLFPMGGELRLQSYKLKRGKLISLLTQAKLANHLCEAWEEGIALANQDRRAFMN